MTLSLSTPASPSLEVIIPLTRDFTESLLLSHHQIHDSYLNASSLMAESMSYNLSWSRSTNHKTKKIVDTQ